MVEDVCLVIKAANQKYDDVKIDCQLSWSILDLKNHLSQHYPSKPKITDQRIIYSGHLLKDNQLLNTILSSNDDDDDDDIDNDDKQSKNTFIFHLVCPQKNLTNTKNDITTTNNRVTTTNESNNNSLDVNITNHSSTNATNTTNWNQFNQMGPDNLLTIQSYQLLLNYYYQYMSYYLLQAPPLDFTSYNAFAFTTTNSYLMMNQNLIGITSSTTTATDNNNNVNENNNNNIDNNNNNNNNNNINNINNNQNNNNNNNNNNNQARQRQAALDDDQLMNNRDWTDWLYTMTKALIVLSIIYFYSSLNRLMLFMSIFLIIYFYKNLFNGLNAINQNNRRNDNNNNNNARIDDGDQQQQNNEIDDDDNSRYSGIRFIWVFISSLFTSLIPDPVPIN